MARRGPTSRLRSMVKRKSVKRRSKKRVKTVRQEVPSLKDISKPRGDTAKIMEDARNAALEYYTGVLSDSRASTERRDIAAKYILQFGGPRIGQNQVRQLKKRRDFEKAQNKPKKPKKVKPENSRGAKKDQLQEAAETAGADTDWAGDL